MVRKYIRKTERGVGHRYSAEDLSSAMQAIHKGLSIFAASSAFNVPRTTLRDRVKGRHVTKRKVISNKPGRSFNIDANCEKELVRIITTLCKWGCSLRKEELLNLVAEYVTYNNIKTQFANNRPGDDWYISFKRRHRITVKKPEAKDYKKLKAENPYVICQFFELLYRTLKELKILDKPDHIFNCDESSFNVEALKQGVLCPIGTDASRIIDGSGKTCYSVLLAINAAGCVLPPHVVFPGKNMYNTWMSEDKLDEGQITYAATENGWMTAKAFHKWFCGNFIKNCNSKRPILLILDGHSSHISVPIIMDAIKNDITILKLPPHTTHLLQSLDVSTFKSLKSIYNGYVTDWKHQIGNASRALNKATFSQIIARSCRDLKKDVIMNGFIATGICPFDRNKITSKMFSPEELKRYEDMKLLKEVTFNSHERLNITADALILPQAKPKFSSLQIAALIDSLDLATSKQNLLTKLNNATKIKAQRVKCPTELLLESMKPKTNATSSIKRRKVSNEAEIVTSMDCLSKLKLVNPRTTQKVPKASNTICKSRAKIPGLITKKPDTFVAASDGNCLFACIAMSCFNSQDNDVIKTVRESTVTYVINHWSDFSAFLYAYHDEDNNVLNTPHKYKSYMSKNAVYGDNVEIRALSSVYHCCIRVYTGAKYETHKSSEYGTQYASSSMVRLHFDPKHLHYNLLLENPSPSRSYEALKPKSNCKITNSSEESSEISLNNSIDEISENEGIHPVVIESIKSGDWYALNCTDENYWGVGVVIEVIGDKVTLDMLHQNSRYVNIFKSIKNILTIHSKYLFYKLTKLPLPVSSRRSTSLKLGNDDFNQICYLFDQMF